MKVSIVLDVICSASYLGFTRFERAVERFRSEGGQVEVEFLPLQLAADASAAGEPLLDALVGHFGPQVVDELGPMIRRAAEDGLVLDYDRAVATNTFEAHRLISVAAAQGRGEPMVERLFRAHFTDGVNVGDPAALRELAREAGVAWSEDGADVVRDGLRRVREAGVRGVPLFSFEGGGSLGVRSEDGYLEALRDAARRAA